MEFLVDGLHLTRTHQKKKVPTTLDKLQHIDIHSHALFAAVEQGHIERVRTILQSTDVDINSVNSDGLSPLDVAVLVGNKAVAKILVAFGAQEGNHFKSSDALAVHLKQLVLEAELRLQELGSASAQCGSSSTGTYPQTTTADSSSGDKQLSIWERRVNSLKRMVLGYEEAGCPDEPFLVAVDVTGTNTVTVRFQEPETLDSHICTKFKVEWSCFPDFNHLAGEREVLDLTYSECHISDLVQGQRYYFRVACGNLKGYSNYVPSSPPSVVPSSWRDVDGREARFTGVSLRVLDNLFTEMRKARPQFAAEIKDIQESSSPGGETPNVQRRKKTTIKQLFTAASKFQKNLRRGVYLSCILYHEDRVLVTNEDFLPVIEVDETYPSCIYNDFHWLMKVACTWDDVKSLRQDMEKSLNSSSVHFRIKLLQAAAQMQTALCIQDLGQLYHKPLRDSQGTLVISMVNYVRSPKSVSVLNSRWLAIGKVVKKASNHDDPNVGEILMTSIQEQIMYHQVSSIRLSRGLYLGYLKMHSSVDLIQVVVPSKTPNVLPHCKIRDNPHVSAEEWEGLKCLRGKLSAAVATPSENDSDENQSPVKELVAYTFQSEQQKIFVDLVASTARRLFSYMEISAEESHLHRLYDVEVVDLTSEVSFLVAVPPAESACAVPGQRDMLLQRGDLLSLPVQVFEMVHLTSYQHNVISRYSRLSCILELDMLLAQHNLREAFSTVEVAEAKERIWKLQEIDAQLNAVKKGIRWLMDLVTFTRDRGSQPQSGPPGILMKTLLATGAQSKGGDGVSLGVKRSLLQLPPRDQKLIKSSASRGSWPGPGVSGAPCLLATEFSKSEQQLNTNRNTAPTTTIASPSIAVATPPPRSAGSAPIVSGTPRKESDGSLGFVGITAGSPAYSNSSVCSASLGVNNSPNSMKGLHNSRSEDTLLLSSSQRVHSVGHQRSRSSVLTTSVSATTSPLLSVRSSIHGASSQPAGSALSVGGISMGSGISGGNITVPSDSQHSLSSEDSAVVNMSSAGNKTPSEDPEGKAGSVVVPIPSSGILQVYAAYKTGLASGTSLKVHVTPQTSAREVVDLVVKQLNLAAILKGKGGPVYPDDRLDNFCLVAVIGARERCLRDDFKPLQLQNPWRKGRLYVRQKHDVLAALDQCARRPTAFL
ncbi:Ankyrin repeat and fibronectin type-III domain-containing protein 1 [Frankliniella fusca]|uniref:Ankyrin repeat and fibronectin type-III domain-containing protein 1 n=1 Tax=Frankliniella fusca TaxID=407009 RepID=A0AAE1LSB6_9NEOP|nr:Ankyrin repeat and fibronectin type-III domain-containing protein 1 [Frankliniella fusca]